MNDIYDLGLLLKDLRKRKGFTQEKLASKLGVTKTIISRYESNTVTPTAETMRAYAEIFDVSLDYLYGLEKIPTSVSVVGITNEQKAVVQSLIEEFKNLNTAGKTAFKEKQYSVLGKIVAQFEK